MKGKAGMGGKTKCGLGRFGDPTLPLSYPPKSGLMPVSKDVSIEMKAIFSDYDMPTPTWFRNGFRNTRNRRAILNAVLVDAGLDNDWCMHAEDDGSFAATLHRFYHEVNA